MSAHALLVEDNMGDVELFASAFDELNTGMELKVAFHNGKIPDILVETSSSNPGGLPKIIFLELICQDLVD